MVAGNTIRLSKLAREFNVGIHTIVEFLHKKGFDIDSNPNTKVEEDALRLLQQEYKVDVSLKKESEKISLKNIRPKKETISIDDTDEEEEIKIKPAAKEVSREPEKIFE
ncbi:MAG: translation initiation factor IF-2, partial [Bacteroidia bacterium]|nr:translation initiation factor IF-2 [Bacteroidia bacterium]